ncbi:hypothetical protein PoB_007609400 [Plakobranchus ocellatus]|uniref:Uncharacterized protein n=1 Tax=Plakobranchus ocellatus TaxID=259542 RepID=A0AAV4DZS7_9GAST|nr:hypothetical protein PoB_007609400 [Plakobranchus ocellatus]
MSQLLCATHRHVSLIICVTRLASATISRIMRGHVMAPPFPLSDRATDVRPGCKTQRIAPTLRQVADLVCARTKEREYLKNMYRWTRELLPPVWAYALNLYCWTRELLPPVWAQLKSDAKVIR